VATTDLSRAEIAAFLAERHASPVHDLVPLDGGFWSAAFAYRVGDDAFVVRFGTIREGFEADQRAMAFARTDLPVPNVHDVGDAFDRSYAISERHYGRFLESVTPDEAETAAATILRLLAALRTVPEAARDGSTWRGWLLDSLVDYPHQHTAGWRATLAADPALDRLFTKCERRIGELVEACPERRDLFHGDLLHRNVLIAEDASEVRAVFSWKCSQRGDFLYDTAWCTFWGSFFPGIAAANIAERVMRAPSFATPEDLVDAAIRHHCYELQIGASHLGWHTWVGEQDALRKVAAHTEMLLERGPA
jgi:aminoglycoside phosphotransferase (APT) family kinase protein